VILFAKNLIESFRDVRKAVLTYIGPSKATLPDILKRTRDVLPDVRKHAFSIISKLEIKSLTIAQRNTLIKNGLNDRDSAVRESCLKTCEEWLQSRGNIIEVSLSRSKTRSFLLIASYSS
jgi:hypothetical protein